MKKFNACCKFLIFGLIFFSPFLIIAQVDFDQYRVQGNYVEIDPVADGTNIQSKYIMKQIMADGNANMKHEDIIKQFKDKDGSGCNNEFAFDPASVLLCEPSGSFNVTYHGFTPEARRAFQYAVDILSKVVDLPIAQIVVADWVPLGPNTLGASIAPWININFPNAPQPNMYYPIAVSNQLEMADPVSFFALPFTVNNGAWQRTAVAHNFLAFSSEFPWYYGLDGCPPAGQWDFVSVVMHELMHGLGYFDSFQFYAPGLPIAPFGGLILPFEVQSVGFNGFPYIFDQFLVNTDPALVAIGLGDVQGAVGFFNFPPLKTFVTNDMLFFDGPNTNACIGGPAKLYAPNPFQPGSSVAHFDESTFNGTINALETPQIGSGQAIHTPGCALAVLRDLGHSTASEVPSCEVVPTMGEWGLLSLGLILLILGVVTIKSRKLVFG